MGSRFHRQYLGYHKINAYNDAGLEPLSSSYYLEGDEITIEDRKLLEFFSGFHLYTEGVDWLLRESDYNRGALPADYPWTFEKVRQYDPVIDAYLTQREQEAEESGGGPYEPNMYEVPAPRSVYFMHATAEAIHHTQMAKLHNPLELPSLLLSLTLTEADFAEPVPEDPSYGQIYNAIMARLQRLRIDERMQLKAQEISEQYGIVSPSPLIRPAYQFWYHLDKPFWHWATVPTEADEVDALVPNWGIESPGCPPIYPSCVMHGRVFKPVFQILRSERVVDTIVNEYTVELPPGISGGFRLPYGAFTGPFLDASGNIISFEGEPQISTNLDVREETFVDGETTTEIVNPTYYTFRVREYNFGPQINPLTGNLVGMLDRPYLFLEDEYGRASTHFTNDTDERRELFARAEALAKQTLIEMWGFLPAWADRYGGTIESYVAIHRGGLRDLPNYDRYFRQASADEKLNMQNWDYMLPYAFSIMVTTDPNSSITETNSGGSSTSTETIESVETRDPITYTFTDTETVITQKLQVKLSVTEVVPEYAVNGDLAVNVLGLGPHSDAEVDIAFRNVDVAWGLETFAVRDPVNVRFELPPIPIETSYRLTKDLFSPDSTIMDHLTAIGPAELEASKQAIQTYLGLIGGSTWLSQYGSAAPIFPDFKEALVLDTHLNKWGKMSVPHKLLVDLAPINSHKQRRVNPNTFTMQAAMLDPQGRVVMFNDSPAISELRYGKLGYHRLGFTDLEEMRLWFAKQSTGSLQIEPSLSGDRPEGALIKEVIFDGTTSLVANYSLSARWYNVTLKGQYDVKGIEFIGRKSARR